LWGALHDRFWINEYPADRRAHSKPFQLQVAIDVGLDVARTIITNSPSDTEAFFDICEGGVVYKTCEPLVRGEGVDIAGVYTSRVSKDRLRESLSQIEFGPCIFQEQIAVETELRVTVIDGRTFTAEVKPSQSGSIDWRRSPDQADISAVDLREDVRQAVLRMMRALGLTFGCFDFACARDGRIVFLEVNPSGQWYWVEQRTGLPLLDSFINTIQARNY
jgi:glutathione synthase/RimK-type ligase-like ATP-grasp enzyme